MICKFIDVFVMEDLSYVLFPPKKMNIKNAIMVHFEEKYIL